MTLEDIDIPPTVEFATAHALVFSEQLAGRLQELHQQYGRADCIAAPALLDDGRLALGCDLLFAIGPGGWLHEMWEAADKAILLPAVEVIPWSELQPEENPQDSPSP